MRYNFIIIAILSLLFSTEAFAKRSTSPWFTGFGVTIAGESSTMVPVSGTANTYNKHEYDVGMKSDIDKFLENVSFHVGYATDLYDGYELSYSMFTYKNSSDSKEGVLSLIEIDKIIGLNDFKIGFTQKKIDLIVPYVKVGLGVVLWKDKNSETDENLGNTSSKLAAGLLFRFGTNTWVDLSYNVRQIGFPSTKVEEQTPMNSTNLGVKVFF